MRSLKFKFCVSCNKLSDLHTLGHIMIGAIIHPLNTKIRKTVTWAHHRQFRPRCRLCDIRCFLILIIISHYLRRKKNIRILLETSRGRETWRLINITVPTRLIFAWMYKMNFLLQLLNVCWGVFDGFIWVIRRFGTNICLNSGLWVFLLNPCYHICSTISLLSNDRWMLN